MSEKTREVKKFQDTMYTITYSVLISYCFTLHPNEKHELIKPEWVIKVCVVKLSINENA